MNATRNLNSSIKQIETKSFNNQNLTTILRTFFFVSKQLKIDLCGQMEEKKYSPQLCLYDWRKHTHPRCTRVFKSKIDCFKTELMCTIKRSSQMRPSWYNFLMQLVAWLRANVLLQCHKPNNVFTLWMATQTKCFPSRSNWIRVIKLMRYEHLLECQCVIKRFARRGIFCVELSFRPAHYQAAKLTITWHKYILTHLDNDAKCLWITFFVIWVLASARTLLQIHHTSIGCNF